MIELVVISRDDEPERLVAIWAEADRLGLPLRRHSVPDDRPVDLSDHRDVWVGISEGDSRFSVVVTDAVSLDDALLPLLDEPFLERALEPAFFVKLDEPSDEDDEDRPRLVFPLRSAEGFEAYLVSREGAAILANASGADVSQAVAAASRRALTAYSLLPAPMGMAAEGRRGGGAIERAGRTLQRVRGRLLGRTIYLPLGPPSDATPPTSISA